MTSETSVVTPERFASGMDAFPQWMESIENRQKEFQRHYDEYEPKAEDIEAVRAYVESHGVKALVLAVDWCPDVWRGLPVIAKISEATGMEMRIFERDAHKDIMAEFLNQGEFESVPTIVFYDRDHRYLGHWIERAKLANEEMAPLRDMLTGKERGTPEFDEAREAYLARTWELADGWRHAQVAEFRELLASALS